MGYHFGGKTPGFTSWNKQFETNVPGATSEEEFWQPGRRTAAVVETAEMTSNENCFIKNILD